MATLNITSPDAGTAGISIEIWARGTGGQPDTHIETRPLGSDGARLSVDATRYLVVREGGDADAKTIDNWSQTPPAPGDA